MSNNIISKYLIKLCNKHDTTVLLEINKIPDSANYINISPNKYDF